MAGEGLPASQDEAVARFAVGDVVLAAAPRQAPVGRVDTVLLTRSGSRLVIAAAYFPGRYVSVSAEEVEATADDLEAGLRWHRLRLDAAAVVRLPAYRRMFGRLVPDPSPAAPPVYRGDDAVQRELDEVLRDDPLTADAMVDAQVRHGVAILRGWVRSVGAKVAADRLARTTPGIWDTRNALESDEELAAVARTQVVGVPALARSVQRMVADLGQLSIELSPGAELGVADVKRRVKVPGARQVSVSLAEPETPGRGGAA